MRGKKMANVILSAPNELVLIAADPKRSVNTAGRCLQQEAHPILDKTMVIAVVAMSHAPILAAGSRGRRAPMIKASTKVNVAAAAISQPNQPKSLKDPAANVMASSIGWPSRSTFMTIGHPDSKLMAARL